MSMFFSLRLTLLRAVAFGGALLCAVSSGYAADPVNAMEAADRSLTAALELNPNSVSLHSRRGDVRLFQGRFADAVKDFEKMIALDPLQDAPHWRLGIAYYFAGDFGKSARQFEKYHAHDGRDRENGIWKCMAQARAEGLEAARDHLLEYPPVDREPFVELYDLFAGRGLVEKVLNQYGPKAKETNRTVQFFALYYSGVYTALTDKTREGLQSVKDAVALFTPDTASEPGSPGYMWQVARLHVGVLERELAGSAGK
jgi:lipoprotein NlpI